MGTCLEMRPLLRTCAIDGRLRGHKEYRQKSGKALLARVVQRYHDKGNEREQRVPVKMNRAG